ncbi:ribosomal protein L7/L12 [Corallococcus sp. CA054B]|uniref:ribosomal protein L7/L12 n=1 Tax=Corallococcus sp. CA054B TaxID=2316734 RepID=UPI00131531E3|nr:ribosomal protein L7/L12 [Corallococcus sp. CA054B]
MSSSFLVLLVIAVFMGALIGLWLRPSHREQPSEPPMHRSPEEGRKSLAELIQAGQTINAIKLYRELYGVGLKEAKDAVEAMRDGRAPMALPERRELSDSDADDAIARAIRDNDLIQAIKLYRAQHGVGLKEAKDAVEAMRANVLRRG